MKRHATIRIIKGFFSDKDGKLAIAQLPNSLLIAWLMCKVVSLALLSSEFETSVNTLSTFILFTWAYMEVTAGSSYFRRVLGVGIITVLVANIV